jgi:alpha-mannosidase
MWGSQVLQRIAQEVRHSENLIVQAEKIAAMQFINSRQPAGQADFDEAWRCLMLAQHHDSWIVPYNHFKIKGSWANAIKYWTGRSDSLSMVQINRALPWNGPDTSSLTIYNTTGHARHEVVFTQDGNGNDIALEARVPAYGYATLDSPHTAKGCEQMITGPSATLENDACKMVFNLSAGGVITSFVDKQTGRDLVGRDDTAFHFNELRGYFPMRHQFCSSMDEPAQAKLIMDNDLAKRIEISGKVAGVPFVQTVTLKKGSPIVDFKLKVLWNKDIRIGEDVAYESNNRRTCFYDTRYMLNVFFPSSFTVDGLYKDAPLDVCKSQLDNTFFNSWDSIKNNVMLHWVDIHNRKENCGLALFSDHTTSYSFGPHHPLALTVQYAGPGLWWRDYPLDGPSEIRYALVAHTGRWDEARLQRLIADWQEPLMIRHGKAAEAVNSYFQSPYRLLSVTQDGEALNFRLFNADGDSTQEKVHFNFEVAKAEIIDLNGNILQPLKVNSGDIKMRMPRFGLRTIRVTLKNDK